MVFNFDHVYLKNNNNNEYYAGFWLNQTCVLDKNYIKTFKNKIQLTSKL